MLIDHSESCGRCHRRPCACPEQAGATSVPSRGDPIDVERAESILGAAAFQCTHRYEQERSVSIELSKWCDLSFEQLERLAEAYGTKSINLRYTASTPDLSDVTPGQPSQCYLVLLEITR